MTRREPKTAFVSRPAPRRMVTRMLRVSFAFLRGGVSFLGFFASFAARSAAFFRRRSARRARNFAFSFPKKPFGSSGPAGGGAGHRNTGRVMPGTPARIVTAPFSQQKSAQNGQSRARASSTNTIRSRMPTIFSRVSSSQPSAPSTAVIGPPPLPLPRSGPARAAGPPARKGRSTAGKRPLSGSSPGGRADQGGPPPQ